MEEDSEHEWAVLFEWKKNSFYGYCNSVERVEELINLISYETSTAYTAVRNTPNFGSFDLTGQLAYTHVYNPFTV